MSPIHATMHFRRRLILAAGLFVSVARIVPTGAITPPTLCRQKQLLVSGGGSHYEMNPNYRSNPNEAMTVGDLEAKYHHQPLQSSNYDSFTYQGQQLGSSSSRPKPLTQVVGQFFASLKSSSPTLYFGTLSIISMFVLWQIPAFQPTLQKHFVCSRSNMKQRRYHTALLSALSHASPMHLLVNMYAFLTFGPSVRRAIASFGLPLWPFALGSALAASLLFLALSPHGACVGLSGVTLAMLAFYARVHPSHQLGFVVGFVPVRLPAEYALIGIVLMSLVGLLAKGARDGVAHGAHLGGIAFGVAYFELLVRGWLTQKR